MADDGEPCQQCEEYLSEYDDSVKQIGVKHHVDICPCDICKEARA